jgi:ABC-type phosphate transport system substrate-binding protein
MRSWIPRRRLARGVALAAGVAAIASLATAPASFAAGAVAHPPAIGQNCQADGHISGAGSTFQAAMMYDSYIYGFQQDVCGPVSTASNLLTAAPAAITPWITDPSVISAIVKGVATTVNGMVAYNYSNQGTPASNGSGAGLRRVSCRTDEFAGTDLPYNSTQLSQINSAPGFETGGSAPQYGCDTASNLNLEATPPPFQPMPPGTAPNWPNPSDSTPASKATGLMSFPTAGGAVALAVNLNGVCSPVPTSINLTSAEVDGIMQGTINEWQDSALQATDPILGTDNCAGNITRVVRFDNSGTTAITMFYLNGIDSSALCQHGTNSTWLSIAISSNNSGQWPGQTPAGSGCTAPNTGNSVAPGPETAGSNGSPPLIGLLDTNTLPVWNTTTDTYTTTGGEGGIGYAELGLWPSPLPAGVSFVNVQNAAGTAFVSAGAPGAASNCSISPSTPGLPAPGTAPAAVGLATDDWANTQTGTNQKTDVAYTGAGYPVCGLTFDLVFDGMHNETGETASPAVAPTSTPGCQLPTPSTNVIGTQSVPLTGNALTVSSTADYPSSGAITVADSGGTTETLTYTGKTATSFTGIPAQGASGGPLSTATAFNDDTSVSFLYGGVTDVAQTLPETTVTMTSTAGLPTAGSVTIAGNTVTYTGKTGTSLTGAAGGTGAVPAGSEVSLNSTTAAASPATSTGEPIPVSPGVMGQCQTVAGPEIGTTNDQLRTLYAFFTYVFSPLGQSYLASATYDALPGAWLSLLQTGFQQNF